MIERELFLGLDVGTQGTKALVLDPTSGTVLGRGSSSYDLLPNLPAGAAEQDPATWIAAVGEAARAALDGIDRARVAGVGVSGQQHGLVVLDERDAVVRPAKLWCDTSTAKEAEELSQTLGKTIPCGFTAPKMAWMRRHEPQIWARVTTVLLPHDYVNFRLTEKKTMECGDASGTGLFDPVRRAFDAVAIRAVDPRVASMLPELIAADRPAGLLAPDGARLLGLREGIVVSAGGGDNMMSAIGAGALEDGIIVVSLGTSGTVFTYSSKPIVDPSGAIAPFCDSTGGWMPLLCVMNMTGVTEEVRDAFGMDHAELTRLAASVPAGSDGLVFLPYLAGERVPNLPHATGALTGVRAGSLRPGHLYRAAIEGTTLNLAAGVDRLKSLGVQVESVRLVGGGSKNPLWRKIVADTLGADVQLLSEPESAALGAAIQAAWTTAASRGRSIGIAELATNSVKMTGDPIRADAAAHAVYRDLLTRFSAETDALFAPRGR